jgi:hypothetical protein
VTRAPGHFEIGVVKGCATAMTSMPGHTKCIASNARLQLLAQARVRVDRRDCWLIAATQDESQTSATEVSWRRLRSAPFLCDTVWPMNLHDELDGDEIVVTKPDSDMMIAYRKAPDRPNLVLTRSWLEPTVSSPGHK